MNTADYLKEKGYSDGEELFGTCIAVLHERERIQGGPRDDGPSADLLLSVAEQLRTFTSDPDGYPWADVVVLHRNILAVSDSWKFPELDPVAELLVPYVSELELQYRELLSKCFPDTAANLQQMASLSAVGRLAGRQVIIQQDRKLARRKFWKGIIRRAAWWRN